MKVLHVIPSVSSVRGGPSKAVLEMVSSLISQGLQVEIATTNDNGPHLLSVPLYKRITYQGVPVWFFPRFSPRLVPLREFAFSLGLTRWLWEALPGYDLLHVHAIFSYPSTVAMAIARHHRVPYLVRPIGQLCHWSLTQGQPKKRLYLTVIERTNLNQAQAIHCTAFLEKNETQSLGLKPPHVVIPLGVHLPPPVPPKRSQDDSTVLFLSRLHPKKGLLNLLYAWQRLQPSLPRAWHLVIAGSGHPDYVATLNSTLKVLDLTTSVQLVGAVEGQAKWALFQRSDLFVLPTLSENFGIVVAEALACGVPVITTQAAPWSDLVTYQCGWWIEVGVEPLVKVLQEAIGLSQHARRQMGDRGRQLVCDRYTWEQAALKLIEIYQTTLGDL